MRAGRAREACEAGVARDPREVGTTGADLRAESPGPAAGTLVARAAVYDVQPYRPPLGGRGGLRCDFNENTQGASPRVLRALRELDPDCLSRYPQRGPAEQRLAQFLSLRPEEVLLTNGADEAIHLLCQTYLEAGSEALIVTPTFAMYEQAARCRGAGVVSVAALEGFAFPAERLLAAVTPRTRLVAIANPNNPTGALAGAGDLLAVVRAAPQAAVLVDEAYWEFCGRTVVGEVGTAANLFVARTFSKAYGLAGLRLGALLGCEQQLSLVRRVASPYNVNAVALACLPPALEDDGYLRRYVAAVRRGRALLQEAFSAHGVRCWPSQANFVLAHLGPAARAFVAAMARRGVLVRDRSDDPGCPGCVRITVGTARQMRVVLAALGESLREVGVSAEPSS